MDYLLTIDGTEWDAAGRPRWRPAEEQERPADADGGYREAAGLRFGGGGAVHLFMCRRCADRPVRVVGQT
jgi:hypothetical protein